MSWRTFDIASKLNNDKTTGAVRDASIITKTSSTATIRGGTRYVDGDRNNTAHFSGAGTIGSGTVPLDDDEDLPAGWTPLVDGVLLPYSKNGIFALWVEGTVEVVGASVPGYIGGEVLGGLLIAEIVVTDALGVQDYKRLPIPASSATNYIAADDPEATGELFFQARVSKFADVILVPSNNFGLAFEMKFDTISDPGDFSGAVGVVASFTHIPITEFS